VTVHLDARLERDISVRSQGSRHDNAAFDDAKRPVAKARYWPIAAQLSVSFDAARLGWLVSFTEIRDSPRLWRTRSWHSSQRVRHPQADVRSAASLRVDTGRWAM